MKRYTFCKPGSAAAAAAAPLGAGGAPTSGAELSPQQALVTQAGLQRLLDTWRLDRAGQGALAQNPAPPPGVLPRLSARLAECESSGDSSAEESGAEPQRKQRKRHAHARDAKRPKEKKERKKRKKEKKEKKKKDKRAKRSRREGETGDDRFALIA